MKTLVLSVALWLASLPVLGQVATTDSDLAKFDPGTLVEAGPHERVWTSGDPLSDRRVVEIGTGMNYWDGQQWVPSQPSFEITEDAFVADRLQYKVRLPANLNVPAAVTVITPDGITLKSTPVGIGLYDAASGQSLIIGAITNCSGVLVGDQVVVYENAFAGVCADVIYKIDRGAFSQDVVITGRLDPAAYGFPTKTTRIQIFTEFYDSPAQPDRLLRPVYVEEDQAVRNRMVSPDLVDEVLGFGEFVLWTGRAATLANLTSDAAQGALVAKQFASASGRTFLVETVEYEAIRADLELLPECTIKTASIRKARDSKGDGYAALPPSPAAPSRVAAARTGTRMAKATTRAGVVIDYTATIGGNINTPKVFQGDTTYFLSSAVFCNSLATIEAGVVFKYPTNANVYLKLNSTVICKASSYRPAIFTAANDSTVGDTLNINIWSGYTGNVGTNYYANPALWVANGSSTTLSNVFVRFAHEAIRFEGAGTLGTVSHAQLINCIRGVVLNSGGGSSGSGGSSTITINNTLFGKVQKAFNVNNESSGGTFYNCTIAGSTDLINSTVSSASATLYNSIFVNVTNLASGSASVSGKHNGFHKSPVFGTIQYTNSSYPFESVGAGNYYLPTNGPFLNVGATTNGLSSSILNDLRKKTVFAPSVLTNTYTSPAILGPLVSRDTDTLDLGWHYDPIDWAINTLTVTNTTLTLTNGVALATFGDNGIWLQDGSQLISEGSPTNHNHLTRFFNVQEQPTNWGGGLLSGMVTINPYNSGVSPPSAQIRFTDFDGLAAGGYHLFTYVTNWTMSSLLLWDSSLNSASFYLAGPTNSIFGLTNNLFERITGSFRDSPQLSLYNNLFRFGTNTTVRSGASTWTFTDNSFDNSRIIDTGSAVSASYNAYINMGTNRFYPTNANDKVLTSFTYRTGPLGDYYHFSSNLINAGSRNATNAGLYHYTVTTNFVSGTHVKETNSIVDIGFHYVALTTNNVPVDTDSDGLPDYLEDRNGNGTFDGGENSWLDPAPSVSITNPVNSQVFVTSPTNITIQATASDNGSVTNVAFYNGTTLLGNDTTSPYSLTWNNVAAGTYTLTAKAGDNLGGWRFSAPVTIIVNAMPSVSLTNPVNNTHFSLSPTNIVLQASASDSDGTITNVAFYNGTNLLGNVTASPYNLAWSNVIGGSYALTARATDNRGAVATSSVVNITVNGGLYFGTNNAYVTFGNNTNLGLKFFTLETWFRRTGAGTTTTTGSGGITAVPLITKGRSNGSDGSNADMNYFLGIDTSGVIAADFEDFTSGANHPVLGITTISNGVWYHAAVTYNGTNWQLYLNGELEKDEGEGGSSSANGLFPRYDSTQHAALGTAIAGGSPAGFFAGVMDEVRVWNYARTRQQIRDNMNREIQNECGLVGRWALNEGVGTSVTNATGTIITGTITGSGYGWTNSSPLKAGGAVLLVSDNTGAGSADAAIKSRLESLGFNVTVKTGSAAASSDANKKTLVVISSSVTASQVNTKFRTSPVPVITWRHDLFDDMGLVVSNAAYYGTTSSQTNLDIISPTHEMAAGLFGTVNVVSNNATFAWGQPTNSAVVVGRIAGNSTNATIFGYEKGYGMVGLVAPARRAGLFLQESAITNLNANGWALFDAAVNWAITAPCPPQLDLVIVIDHSNSVDGQPLADAKTYARYITTNMDLTLDQVGIVSFDANATTNINLSHDTNAILSAINGISQSSGSRLDKGLNAGQAILNANNHVIKAAQVMVVITDGDPDGGTNASVHAASQAKLAGTRIICLGVGSSPHPFGNVLLNIATSCSDYYANPTSPQLDQVLLSINDTLCRISTNQPPSVTITNPTDGAILLSSTNVLLQATASDVGGTITNVTFYNGGNTLGTATPGTGNSYSFVWTNAALGTNSLTAVAKDNGGLGATSSVVTVIIPSVPQVHIIHPTNGAVFLEGASVPIAAQVVNTVGTVTNVEFFTNYIRLGNDATLPYTFHWDNIARGSYGVFARAYNHLGTVGQSPIVNVLIDGPPTITILTPQNNAQPLAPANIRLTSIAEDDGTVTNVTYFLYGTNNIGFSTVSPYAVSTNNLPARQYWFKAVATDNRGQTASAYVTNNVQKQFPSVEILSPQTNDVFAYEQPILIQARATDPDGTVTNVVFRVGTMPIGTNAVGVSNIFSFLWTNAPLVTSTNLFAVATDNDGQSRTSNPVNIKIQSCQSLAALTNFTLSASNIPSGLIITGAVHLASGAVDGGQVVNLACTNVGVIIPGSVFIPAGTVSLEFPIWTRPAEETSTNLVRASTASAQFDIFLEILGGTGEIANPSTNQTHLQITADTNTAPPLQLARSIIGEGVFLYTNSVTFVGTNWSAGLFVGGSSIIGIESGLVLGSGNITNLTGSNTVCNAVVEPSPYMSFNAESDTNLDSIATGATEDVTILAFGFIPESETVTWDYVFASEEYDEFDGTQWNDVFGFFVNGTNVAFLETESGVKINVAINNVNATTNVVLYRDNRTNDIPGSQGGCIEDGNEFAKPFETEMDGFTRVLRITAPVIAGSSNYVKMAIADVNDARYDSLVMIRAGSFRSGGVLIHTRDDLVRTNHASISLGNTNATVPGDDAVFNLAAIRGTVEAAVVARAGRVQFNPGNRFEFRPGVQYSNVTASFGLATLNANQSASPFAYDTTWALSPAFYPALETNLNGSFHLPLVDQISGLCGSNHMVIDQPHGNWPTNKNILTFAVHGNRQVPVGRCIDMVLSGINSPLNGDWDIVYQDQIIASPGKPNGWDVEEDHTVFSGFIVTVPTNAIPDRGYEIRSRKLGATSGQSAIFTVMPRGSIPSAPVLLPLRTSTNMVASSGTSISLTVAIDAGAPLGGSTVSIKTNGVFLTAVVVPEGLTSVTTNITVLGNAGSDFEIFASYNGYRKAKVRVAGGCSTPATPGNLTIATNSAAAIQLTWSPVPSATGYNIRRSVYAPTNFVLIFSGLTATNFIDRDVTAPHTNYYRITAVTNWCESDFAQTNLAVQFPGRAPAPAIIPHGGTYNDQVKVLITNYIAGSTIYYTTNGEPPTVSSPSFSGGGTITLTNNATVRAYVQNASYSSDSRIVSANFIIAKPISISCSQTNYGTLTATNAFSTVWGAGFFNARYVFNAVSGDVGKLITATASSTNFDTVLFLKDGSTNVLAGNDDYSDDTTDSRVYYRVRNTGLHVFEVTSYFPWETGDFSITLNCQDIADLNAFTNAYPAFTTNSAPLPNFGAIDFGTNALGVSVTNWITLTNSGKSTLVISNVAAYPRGATNNGNGFFVTPTTMTIQSGNTNHLAVWLVSTNPAIFSGYLVFESNDGAADGGFPDNPFFVELTGQVKPNPPSPVVYIYHPTNGMNIPATNLTITNVTLDVGAIAFDPDGISRVVFLTNGTTFVTVSNSPYQFTWTNPPAGSYVLKARSFDSLNNQLDSTNINITVGAPTLVLNSTNNCVSLSNRLYAVEARLTNGTGQAVSGATVTFIVSGAHNFTNTGSSSTDSSGRVVMTYTGTNSGSDWIFASASVGGVPAQAQPLVRSWAQPAGCTTVSNISAALGETDGYGKGCLCSPPISYSDYYSITGAVNDLVTLKMKSTNFSTFIFLLDTNCNRIAWTNEMLSLNDSQLRVMLPSNGTYIVEATSSDQFKTGNYTLEIRCGGETAPDIAALVFTTNFPSHTLLDMGVTSINDALSTGIVITNKGNAALNITGYSFTLPVFSITPSPVTTIAQGSSAGFTVQFLSTNVGQYTGSLVLTNDDPDENPFVINLTAIANPNGTPPTVTITAPPNNSSNIAPANIIVQASATPNGSGVTITNVAFVFRSQGATYLIGNDFTYPYSAEWQNVPAGNYELLAVAQDSEGRTKVSAPVAVTVKPTSQNRQPVTAPDYPTVLANSANNVFYVLTNDYDPDGDLLTITNVTLPAFAELPIITDGGRAVRFTPKPHQSGSDGFSYDVSDGKGGAKRERVWITIEGGPMPLVQIDDPDPNTTLDAGTTNIVTVSFPPPTVVANIVRVEYYVGEDKIGEVTSAPFTSFAWHTRAEHCECGLKARVYDKFGQFSDSFTVVYNIVPPTTNFPVATISSPGKEYYVMGGVPQLRTTIVQDGVLVVTGSAYRTNTVTSQTGAPEYKVIIYSPKGSIARDTGWIQAGAPIFNSPIITNDLTTLRNDVYELELLVRDDYQTVSDKVQFALDSNLKIGPFTFSEQDMVIPVNGLPLTVVRTYDSMNPNKGDFGYSWTYAINDLDVTLHETRVDRRPLFDDEEGNGPGGTFSLRVAGDRDVTLTLPDGRRTTFYYYEVPGDCGGDDGVNLCAEPRYFSPPGVTAKLRPVNKYGSDIGGYDFYTKVWKSAGAQTLHENFDFPGFILTLQDGTEFYLTRPHEGDFLFLPDDAGNEDDGFGEITSPNNFIVSPYGKPRVAEIRQRSGDRIVINPDGFVDGKTQFSVDHFNSQDQKTRSIHFVRDDHGRISEIRDPISGQTGMAVVKYEYDNANNLARVLKLLDRSTGLYLTNQYFYENSQFPHYITKVVDPRGYPAARNLYDEQGRLIGIIDASGRTNRFEHDLANRREIQYDRRGNPTIHTYNNQGRILTTINALGYTNSFTYDEHGGMATSTDALGNTTSFTRDSSGNLLSVTGPHPAGANPAAYTARFVYNEFGDQAVVIMPTGGSITNTYDSVGRLLETRDQDGRLIEKTTWDGLSQVRSEEDRIGKVSTYNYDAMGDLTNIVNSAGGSLTNAFDANGWITNAILPDLTTGVRYDAQGRETLVDAGGGRTIEFKIGVEPDWTEVGGPTIPTMKRTFDEQSRLSSMQYANGSTKGVRYDANGRIEYETNEVGEVTHYLYDAAGRCIQVTDLATGVHARNVYDAAGRTLEEVDAMGNRTGFSYNPDGSITSMTNALGHVWSYFYDSIASCCGGNNSSVIETDPFGRQKEQIKTPYGLPLATIYRSGAHATSNSITYWSPGDSPEGEPEEFIESITDEGGHVRVFGYTDMGQFLRASDLSGVNFWTNDYDDLENLSGIVSPTGERTSFTYDGQGNVETIQFPDGNWLTNTYTAVNLLQSSRLPTGTIVNFLYDEFGRQTNRATTGESIYYSYNHHDQVEMMEDNSGTTTNLYGGEGQLLGMDLPGGASVRYQYDALGRVTNVVSKAGSGGQSYTNAYKYDAVGNLVGMTTRIGAQTLDTIFEYDRANRKTRRVLPNGITTTYAYDWRDRVTNIVHRSSSGVLLASAGYQRDAMGEPTRIMREDGSYVVLAYDRSLRLTNEVFYNSSHTALSTNSYGYDASGSRIRLANSSGTFTNAVFAGFQVEQIKNAANGSVVASQSYDAAGRVVAINRSGQALQLGYNVSDQLTAVTNTATTNVYVYDGKGRRVKALDNGTIERRFVVAPPGVGSLDSPLLLADGSGALQRGYVYAGDVPLLQFDESGNVTYYLEDAIGSVIGLAPSSNPDSTTTTRFFYDSFGQTRGTAGPTAIIPAAVGGDFRFQGVWLETATELYHMRARDYDPRTGQFLSRDPVPGELRAPEALHPYVFALNNPHIYSDRSGQFSMAEITVVGAIQFILNTLRGIAIQEVKATIVSKLVDAMTTVLLGQLKYLGVPLDWASIVKKLEDDPGIGTYYGNVFDRSIWNAFCWGVKQVPGLKRVGEYLHHHVKVNAYGIGVGTPLTPGENCDGVNEGPKGLSAGVQFSSYPDLIVGRPPLWPVGGTPRRTEIDGEVKYSSKVLLESYVHPGYMKHQLRAINAYAAKHTKWRTSVFIVGVEVDRNMIKRYLSRKQQQAAKMVLMGKGAGNRVVNLYVPIRKKPNN